MVVQTTGTATGLPGIPNEPLERNGVISPAWYQFFFALWNRTGGSSGSATSILDKITNIPGSILYRAAASWLGLNPGAQYTVLRMGAADPEWDVLDGNSFGSQAAALFFKSPAAASGIAKFLPIATADMAPIAGQFPGTKTNDNATAGNVGEYISSTVLAGAAVALTSTVSADITSIPLTAGDWHVWGIAQIMLASGTTSTGLDAWTSQTSATLPAAPNNGGFIRFQGITFTGTADTTLTVAPQRISLPAAASVYLSAHVNFSVSTAAAYGFLGARRVR